MEGSHTEQPTVCPDVYASLWPLFLSQEPAEVSVMDYARRVADSSLRHAHGSPQQTLCREKGHLSVVSDGAVSRDLIADSAGPEPAPNLLQG